MVVGDFNQDGKQDLAVLSASGPGSVGSVNVYLGNGDGTFQAPKNAPVAAIGSGPTASRLLATGDFNRDGVADLVATNAALNQVAVSSGMAMGRSRRQCRIRLAMRALECGGRGHQPGWIPRSCRGLGRYRFGQHSSGNGDGTFQPFIPVALGSSQVGSVALGDFDQDGWPDLATTSAPDNQVYIRLT